jgi:hypothetical protein
LSFRSLVTAARGATVSSDGSDDDDDMAVTRDDGPSL